ncbi:MAG: hypothetical protein Q8L82_08630 [Nitrosomonas sp.]|nr:hypothetical protein [Nitrosomonas sp.]
MHKTILIFLLIITTNPAWAEWSKMGEANDRTQYIDYTSLRKNGHLVKAWSLVDLKKKEGNYSPPSKIIQKTLDRFLGKKNSIPFHAEKSMHYAHWILE